MATKWDGLFGNEFYIVITNEERKYMGLNPIESGWDLSQFYSKTNLWHKRTSVFWHKDIIKKIVYEEKRLSDNRITYESIMEYDTDLLSENREWLLPITTRGKKKKISATNILAINPFGCEFHFYLDTANKSSAGMSIYNRRNNKVIAVGEADKINMLQ